MSEPDQAAAIAFLADPASHGGAAVERIDTHASVVFLAGDRAFKLKRAVRFSYLDYSTLALRERFCRAELALNRRTAPELYEEVCPITRDAAGRLSFGGTGVVVDWVVAMRRFDQETLFDRMAERGQLSRALMFDLAEQIARFHAAAEIDRESGGAPGMAATTASDARNLRAAVPATLDAGEVEALIAATQAELARVAPLLDARRRLGKVRHCHGDLHLRNICLVAGRPTLFDGVEFSRLISNIDVLYDLAFLLMDLHARGLDALANAVFNRYLDLQDEGDGLPALPLFLSVRAAVRAHVGAAAAGRQTLAEERARTREEACRYLVHASDLLKPRPPRLVAIGGLSGTGKSTVAYGLAPELGGVPGARVLRSDTIRKRLFGAALTDRLPPSAYSAEVGQQVYLRIRAAAAAALGAGRSVVADAVYARRAERDAIAAVAAKAQVPFVGLWLEASAEALAARIAARRGDASDATAAVLRQQLTYDLGDIDWHRIDAGGPAHVVIDAAREISARALAVLPAAADERNERDR
jgi:aminoglycoside phosphotransferase family enzyme/predicted kinase